MNECARRGGVKSEVNGGKDGGMDKGIVSGGTIEVMVMMSDSGSTTGSMGGWVEWGLGPEDGSEAGQYEVALLRTAAVKATAPRAKAADEYG